MAVPGPELRVRAGDGQAGRRAVSPAARRGPAGRAAGPGRLGRCRGGPALAAAEHLIPVPRAREAREEPVRMLFEHAAGPTGADGAPGVFCCGLRVVSMDGSMTDVPDSAENDEFFGRPSNQSRDGAFPQVRWVAAAESGTGSLLGAAMGPYRSAEQPLARDLLGCFGPGMLVLADRKFLSWSLAREFLATGARILWRASASFTLKPVKALADGTYLAELRPPRKSDGPVLTVRVIEYTVRTARRRRQRGDIRGVRSGHRPARHRGVPGAGPGVLLPGPVGLRDRHRPPQDGHGRGAARAAVEGPRGRDAGNVGAVRRLPGHMQDYRHRGERGGHPPGQDQLPARPGRRDGHRRGFPPLTSQNTLATFLLKILMPGFLVRDRPDRASPRKTKKAGDFPARKPGEPSVTNVVRKIEFHLLYPWQIT